MVTRCPVCMNDIDEKDKTCPACGFNLHGRTHEFAPISLDDIESEMHGRTTSENAVLKVIRGPQRGLSYPLGYGKTLIGRSPQCDIFLNDMTVSRKHAHIEYKEGIHTIYDDRSYNGVWVNNIDIESKPLSQGDCIQIGVFCLRYEQA